MHYGNYRENALAPERPTTTPDPVAPPSYAAMRIPALLLSLTLPLAALAGPQGDDLGRFLADRDLVQRLEQAGRELSTRTGEP